MEHRYSIRKTVSLDVLLYYQGLPVTICKTRNIGFGGMSVYATKMAVLPKNAAVEIEFLHEDSKNHYRMPAYVVHKSGKGIGLLFSFVSQGASQMITDLIAGTTTAGERTTTAT